MELGGRGPTEIRVLYDDDQHEIEIVDVRGQSLLRQPVEQEVEVSDGVFRWQGRDLVPYEEDWGLAIAFAHLVNTNTYDQNLAGEEIDDDAFDLLTQPMPGATRYQYAIINVGIFRTPQRMGEVLALAGQSGWRLVHVLDKSSNWLTGLEKGFMLLTRPIPDGFEPSRWCVVLRT